MSTNLQSTWILLPRFGAMFHVYIYSEHLSKLKEKTQAEMKRKFKVSQTWNIHIYINNQETG